MCRDPGGPAAECPADGNIGPPDHFWATQVRQFEPVIYLRWAPAGSGEAGDPSRPAAAAAAAPWRRRVVAAALIGALADPGPAADRTQIAPRQRCGHGQTALSAGRSPTPGLEICTLPVAIDS